MVKDDHGSAGGARSDPQNRWRILVRNPFVRDIGFVLLEKSLRIIQEDDRIDNEDHHRIMLTVIHIASRN